MEHIGLTHATSLPHREPGEHLLQAVVHLVVGPLISTSHRVGHPLPGLPLALYVEVRIASRLLDLVAAPLGHRDRHREQLGEVDIVVLRLRGGGPFGEIRGESQEGQWGVGR